MDQSQEVDPNQEKLILGEQEVRNHQEQPHKREKMVQFPKILMLKV